MPALTPYIELRMAHAEELRRQAQALEAQAAELRRKAQHHEDRAREEAEKRQLTIGYVGPSLVDAPNHPVRTDESCPPPDGPRYAAAGDGVTALAHVGEAA